MAGCSADAGVLAGMVGMVFEFLYLTHSTLLPRCGPHAAAAAQLQHQQAQLRQQDLQHHQGQLQLQVAQLQASQLTAQQ